MNRVLRPEVSLYDILEEIKFSLSVALITQTSQCAIKTETMQVVLELLDDEYRTWRRKGDSNNGTNA